MKTLFDNLGGKLVKLFLVYAALVITYSLFRWPMAFFFVALWDLGHVIQGLPQQSPFGLAWQQVLVNYGDALVYWPIRTVWQLVTASAATPAFMVYFGLFFVVSFTVLLGYMVFKLFRGLYRGMLTLLGG